MSEIDTQYHIPEREDQTVFNDGADIGLRASDLPSAAEAAELNAARRDVQAAATGPERLLSFEEQAAAIVALVGSNLAIIRAEGKNAASGTALTMER